MQPARSDRTGTAPGTVPRADNACKDSSIFWPRDGPNTNQYTHSLSLASTILSLCLDAPGAFTPLSKLNRALALYCTLARCPPVCTSETWTLGRRSRSSTTWFVPPVLFHYFTPRSGRMRKLSSIVQILLDARVIIRGGTGARGCDTGQILPCSIPPRRRCKGEEVSLAAFPGRV